MNKNLSVLPNKLEKLVRNLCPDGVEYVKLGEVAQYCRGVTYNKSDETDSEEGLKILRANNIDLSTNRLNLEDVKKISSSVKVRGNQKIKANDILISTASGSKEHVGKVAYVFNDMDYYYGGFMAVLRSNERLDSRFLFHLLVGKTFNDYLRRTLSSTTINNLSSRIINEFKIPLPPLDIQKEITKILNEFTELEAELEAELECRKKQYEYYSNELLSFNEDGEYKELGKLLERTKGTAITAKRMSELNKDGAPIKIFAGGKTVAYVDYGDIPNKDVLTEESIVVKSRGIIGFEYIDKPFSHKNEFWSYHSNNPNVSVKYVYYYLRSKEPYFQRIGQRMSKMPQLSIPDTDKYKIPIPPLSEQKRIVSILDKFDSLVNDMSIGLPAELNARRKQYEYYRNKLLTFKEYGK
ncbi:MAG: restriction endonuclease subunit S [Candidatus Dojkabacteria bacterium]